MTHPLHHFINGHKVMGSEEGRFGEVYNPASGQISARVPFASPTETERAIQAAAQAFPHWAGITPVRRSRVLFKFREMLETYMDYLSSLITQEHGKTLADAKAGIRRGLEVVEFACGIPHLLKGEFSTQVGTGVDSWSMRQPLGVCVGITPFNFPAMVPMWMFPMALACGNTFVLKPSEKDPSAALFLAEVLQEAGLPDGVFNVINGDKPTVDTLLSHPQVQAISFVGSTPVAESIYQTGSAVGKRVQALGGAKNHMVILPDADLDLAVNGLMSAAYGSAGERCMAISIAVAVGEIADRLVERLIPKIQALKVGPGTDSSTEMGPLITAAHRQRVLKSIDLGIEAGAKLRVDGRQISLPEDGFFLGGCLFDHVTPEMDIYREEIFGPVLGVVRVPDLEAAIRLVNGHEFGNGVAIFTQDGGKARQFCAQVQVGMVGVNISVPVPMAFHCFGGWKRSLFGPLHVHGPDGVRFYTRLKTITARWSSEGRQGSEYSLPTM